MKKLVKVTVQTSMENILTESTREYIEEFYNAPGDDEGTDFQFSLVFETELTIEQLVRRAKLLLADLPELYYVDTIYRYEGEFDADRFVVWQDGRYQSYTGKMEFTEDK